MLYPASIIVRTLRQPWIVRGIASLVLLAQMLCLGATVGCGAYGRAAAQPEYRLIKQPKVGASGKALYRRTDETRSIFATLDALPFFEDPSARVRAKQKGIPATLLRVPAGIVEAAYLIGTSPLLLLSYMLALPVWYDTDRDATLAMEPLYWEEYPWWLVTRGLWLVDSIFHDLPYLAFAWPYAGVTGREFGWKDEMELDAFE